MAERPMITTVILASRGYQAVSIDEMNLEEAREALHILAAECTRWQNMNRSSIEMFDLFWKARR